ncbi:hypothetical protein BYT27DRAFT_7220846 [Phlegmacium glaucopus]|nr:hypothetical protein BYT27DRAFT_7220846 [Phlegmacium glaucopus]
MGSTFQSFILPGTISTTSNFQASPPPPQVEWKPPGLETNQTLKLTKHPTARMVPLNVLVAKYGATHFRTTLAHFVALTNNPNLTCAQLKWKLWGICIPFSKLPVWHHVKFVRMDLSTSKIVTADSVHCCPGQLDSHGKPLPSRFDTALINDSTGEDIGLDGYHVGRICVVFSLPKSSLPIMFTNNAEILQHLAYVEWYSPLSDRPEPNHLLYKISPHRDADGSQICSVTPVANIHCSVHLFPKFGAFAPPEWTMGFG